MCEWFDKGEFKRRARPRPVKKGKQSKLFVLDLAMIKRPLNEVLRGPFLQHSIRIQPVVCAKRARFFSVNPQDNKSSASPPVLVDKLKQWQSTARDRSLKQLSTFVQSTERNLSLLGGKLNQVTGYELVEELKRKVIEQGKTLY
jgi:hypothetical protein